MPFPLPVEQFLEHAVNTPVIDVRSPAEFEKGHVPDAHNIPLFKDEERAAIGTLYKKEGRDAAVLEGLRIVGPKMASLVERSQAIAIDKKVLVHCWRGGMRSSSFAWLLEQAGMQVEGILQRGYKAYRREVMESFERPIDIVVLGGRTGSGKTEILQELAEQGEQIIDLEGLAHHKGSAFGALGQHPQPNTEHFQNLTHQQLLKSDPQRRIWVEDESALVGLCRIADPLFLQMRQAPVYYVDVPLAARVQRLVKEYGDFPKEKLAEPIRRIEKRLGGQHVKAALEALDNGDMATVAEITLKYYDKAYDRGTSQRDPERVQRISVEGDDPKSTASTLLSYLNERHDRKADPAHAIQ